MVGFPSLIETLDAHYRSDPLSVIGVAPAHLKYDVHTNNFLVFQACSTKNAITLRPLSPRNGEKCVFVVRCFRHKLNRVQTHQVLIPLNVFGRLISFIR